MVLGKVYKIVSPNTDKIYIGSTKYETLKQRFQIHSNPNQLQKCTSRAIIEAGDAQIILLEQKNYHSRETMRKAEYRYIHKYRKICVNKNSNMTKDFNAYMRNYCQTNKDWLKVCRDVRNRKKHEIERKKCEEEIMKIIWDGH